MNIDITLLRAQRDTLLELDVSALLGSKAQENIDGLINFLDAVLDEQEGFLNNEQEQTKTTK